MWDALGRRLRRNYLWLFGVLVVSWVVKVLIHPFPAYTYTALVTRIAIGPIPAWLVLLVGVLFNMLLLWMLISTREVAAREDETLPREEARQRMGTGEEPNQ